MVAKRILCPDRLRRVPRQFSWIDQRLVQDNYISGISHHSLSLYLFLVTVSDADGLSYYSDTSLGHYLGFDPLMAQRARAELSTADLIVYCYPLYQVLCLKRSQQDSSVIVASQAVVRGKSEPTTLGDILRQAIGGAQ